MWGGAIAATGIVLAIFGIIVWAGGYAVDHVSASSFGGGGSSRTWLGSVLSIAAAIIGYVLAAGSRRGPLNTAGVTASAFAVPVAMVFLTFGPSGDGLPYNADATVLVSIAIWLLSYFLMPGTRGHALYLGLSAFFLWDYILQKVAPSSLASDAVSPFFGAGLGGFSGTSHLKSDLTQMAVASLAIGSIYYVSAFALDRRGMRGVAQAFAFAGFPAVAGGIGLAAYPAGQVGTGILLIIVSVVLAYTGTLAGRRFTTWIWAAGAGLGVVLLIAKASPDNKTAAGILFLIVGGLFVLISVAVSTSLNEREYPAE